jgi:hypothetical protein
MPPSTPRDVDRRRVRNSATPAASTRTAAVEASSAAHARHPPSAVARAIASAAASRSRTALARPPHAPRSHAKRPASTAAQTATDAVVSSTAALVRLRISAEVVDSACADTRQRRMAGRTADRIAFRRRVRSHRPPAARWGMAAATSSHAAQGELRCRRAVAWLHPPCPPTLARPAPARTWASSAARWAMDAATSSIAACASRPRFAAEEDRASADSSCDPRLRWC